MKTIILSILVILISITSHSQKPKKTFNHEKFAQKVQFSMTPELIGKLMPDFEALQYISGKTGTSIEDLKKKKETDFVKIKEDIQVITESGIYGAKESIELTNVKESPIKTADIIVNYKNKAGKYQFIFTNCVQTNISWYLGDGIILAGDGVKDIMAKNEAKKQKAENGLLGKLSELEDKQNDFVEDIKKQEAVRQAKVDSMNALRPGYEAKYQAYKFLKEKTNMPMEGYYVLNDGTKVNAIIAYQKPEFFVGDAAPGFSLFICKELTGRPVDLWNVASEPNFKEHITKDKIKAFYLKEELYKNVGFYGWVVALNEGAIHSYITVVKLVAEEKVSYVDLKQTQKLTGKPYGSPLLPISEKNMLELMSDAPEIVQSYKDGEYTLYEAEVVYNVWYEKNHPGTVNYVFGKDYSVKPKATTKPDKAVETPAKSEAVSTYEKELAATIDKAHRAPKQDYFADRPTSVSPSIASAKPEVKVKKESFLERINRIKSDGNKVGVLVRCKNLYVNPKDLPEGLTRVKIQGSYEPLEGIGSLSSTTVEVFNKGFGVDVFEAVDYSLIPVKEAAVGQVDDWWSTKYKMIIIYDLTPFYNSYYKTNVSTGKKEYKAQMKVSSEVYVMAAEEATPNKLKYVTKMPDEWGKFSSKYFTGPYPMTIDIIQELKEKINPPSDSEIILKLIESQQKKLEKFIKKKSK